MPRVETFGGLDSRKGRGGLVVPRLVHRCLLLLLLWDFFFLLLRAVQGSGARG